MVDDMGEDMNMAAFVGSYLDNNKSAPSSQEPEALAEGDTLFCTPSREEEDEIKKPFNLHDAQGSTPASQKRCHGSAARPLPTQYRGEAMIAPSNSDTQLKRSMSSVSENKRALEERTAVPSIERNETSAVRTSMGPPPKPAAAVPDVDAQTEFLRSLISKSSNLQKKPRGKPESQDLPVASQSTPTTSKQGRAQIKKEPRDDANLTTIPEQLRPLSSFGAKRSLSIIALDRTPPAKRIRLQELAHRKIALRNKAEEMKVQIETEKQTHEDQIAQFEAEKRAYEAACAEQEAELRQQEEQDLGEIQELEDVNRKLDQKLQRQRAVQQEQLAFWREERQQLGISTEDEVSSIIVDDEEDENPNDRNLVVWSNYRDGEDWP